MLTIHDTQFANNCQGTARRDFLKVGGLGLAGLTLPDLLQAKANGLPVTGKSVVLLFLQGGPPHIEFFDPKMNAPAEIRSITGEVKTGIPGVTFGGTFPKLAKLTDKLSVVRSYGSKNSAHTYNQVASGKNSMKAAMGAIYSRVAGSTNPASGMPNNVIVLPEAVQDGLKLNGNFETQALPTLTDPGSLGASMGAFNPSGGGQLQEDMSIAVDPARLQDRRSLLGKLNVMRRQLDSSTAMASTNHYQQQAFDVLSQGIADAFDIGKESPATRARYDTSYLFDAKKLQKWHDMKRATNLLGHQMLMARRLCEAGCGFVTVSDCGWDYHANNNSPKNMAGLYPMGGQVDHAVSAFIEDIHARGLQDDILLVVTSEMGRSPKLNKNGGRDHYGELTSLLFSGGGLNMGQVIGQSDRGAARPATRPYDPTHLLGTIMHTLFDMGELRVTRGLPSDLLKLVDEVSPIEELV